MLINKNITTKWNSKTKKYYESLGYQYTKIGDSFDVLVSDLKKSSSEKILVKCDYCSNKYFIRYADLKNGKDACYNCKYLKAKETVLSKYNVSNIMKIEGIKEKRDNTIFSIYGVENVFMLPEIKEKIAKTNLRKYGNKSFTKTNLYNFKRKETCLKKYGVDSHMKTDEYRNMFRGENSPVWKGGMHDIRWDRLQPQYKEWRNGIFGNNNYICQKCFEHSENLEAHHIFNWNDNPEKRYDLENGITFCRNCHNKFHRKYGKKDNNIKQLTEYLKQT